MTNEVYYLMSQKQLNRYSVISKLNDGLITVKDAAECLGLSERQIIRLKKGVKEEGAGFLKHKNTGRKPQHAIPDEIAEKIVALKKSETYLQANFKHFQELLEEHEGIKISYGSLYNILKSAGLKSPKKRRRFKPHRRRTRKPQEGLLIQMDASPFDWLGIGENFSLHGAIDDATSSIKGLYMAKHECLQGYFETVRFMLHNSGIPVSIYADRHAIFQSPKKEKLTIEDQLAGKTVKETQFGRAMGQLGVTVIAARSPQAKGRIERLWETLQSRLPIEFKLHGITTLDEANAFLSSYIPKFNKQFAVKPEKADIAFRPLTPDLNTDYILCIHQKRVFDNGGVFSFYNKHFKIVQTPGQPVLPKRASIDVLISPSFGVKASYKGLIYDTMPYLKSNEQKAIPSPSETTSRKPWTPPDSHYYKYGHNLIRRVTYEDSDRDILQMLERIFLSRLA